MKKKHIKDQSLFALWFSQAGTIDYLRKLEEAGWIPKSLTIARHYLMV